MQAFSSGTQFARESAMLKLPEEGRKWASQRERGGGGREKRKRLPENTVKMRNTSLLDARDRSSGNEKPTITKQPNQSKDSHCLKKNKLEFIIVFILTESQCNSPQLMKLQFKLQFILLNSSL